MNDINIMKKDIFQSFVKYQLSSFSQKLISPTDPSQFTLTYAVLLLKIASAYCGQPY